MSLAGVVLAWWMPALAGIALGVAAAFFAMLSLSASTAYGTEYHTLTSRQRVMARGLYLGSLVLALACGLCALGLVAWSLRLLFSAA